MKLEIKYWRIGFISLFSLALMLPDFNASAQSKTKKPDAMLQAFQHPPEAAKPWVFWYWMQASVSKAGITADLQAMKDAGIGGAYLMPIKGVANPPLINPPVAQLTPEWWQMVKFAMSEADRIGVKLAMHDCDGFAVAGGPWITPELSMQKVVWSKTIVKGGKVFKDTLARSESYQGYYKDIAVFAYPTNLARETSTETIVPTITTSKPGVDARFLAVKGNKKNFTSDSTCWIQYAFEQPFTCRSVTIQSGSNSFQAQRLLMQISADGKDFKYYKRLKPARSGWQDGDAPNTYSIPPVTAKYFRFVYDKTGTEPGAEDIDADKWKPNLKVSAITLYSTPRINQYEGKNGQVWRVAERTKQSEIADSLCIPRNKLINISKYMDANGKLNWNVPAGDWVILRMGHTSTGHTNETGGAGRGLECDKFNPQAVKLQFNSWFGEAVKQAGPELAKRALKIFHVDSWECGSQNWSPVFRAEFIKRRGYDPVSYLPAMAGVPVVNVDSTENFLHDVRQTIAEVLVDNFYHTMATLAHAQGFSFSAESVAPTMTSDGLLHFKESDLPMGEFWLNSPTHDKPNDMLDAISGGHIYGKNIIQAEAFTEVRMDWGEYPGMLKTLADRNFALGINRFVLHVFVHNPWTDRKPGMTLDGVGTFFQRDQTWFKPGKAFFEYLQRCQAMLQMGKPVVDVAVFTGNELPGRAVLPDRLVNVLPGIFGKNVVDAEAERQANVGQPMHTMPAGVNSQANTYDPANWVDPLRGYAYDSVNPDALMGATVNSGRIELPGGASYGVLVLPGNTKMDPQGGDVIADKLSAKIKQLVKDGSKVIINGKSPFIMPNVNQPNEVVGAVKSEDKGYALYGPYMDDTFEGLTIKRDMAITEGLSTEYAKGIAWNHRAGDGFDIYFIANQKNVSRTIDLSLRVSGRVPELWNPVDGTVQSGAAWSSAKGRTDLAIQLAPNASVFVVLRKASGTSSPKGENWADYKTIATLTSPWNVQFDPAFGGPTQAVDFPTLTDWSKNADVAVKYYSGTASYQTTFNCPAATKGPVMLELGEVNNIAAVKVNGINCGVAWTAPYRVNISKALHVGQNNLVVEVSNTWANRLIGDNAIPVNQRVTWTTAPFRLEGKPLLPAGLMGPVRIVEAIANK